MANQYTKAEEEGREKPKGTNQFIKGTRDAHSEATKDKMRAERAAIVLEEIMGEKEASRQERIAAAKALLPFGKASLSSVTQTITEEAKTEEEILGDLRALLAANPNLAKHLNIGFRVLDGQQTGLSDNESVAQQQQSAA